MGARSGGRIDPFRLVGTTLDRRFRIDDEVAEGGYGVVYRAYQITLDRPVALKVLKVPGDLSNEERSQFQRNFAAEARTIARLRHPSIVEVFDFGVSSEREGPPLLWMALEWLDGRTLEEYLEAQRGEAPISPAAVLAFLRPAIESIAYAHGQGVVHRDLKPGNLIISKFHGTRFIKVLDFGISKIMTAHEQGPGRLHSGRTTRGASGFSPAYAAPEQVAQGRTGPWTDVHALGLMITEMVTNRQAYAHPESQIFEQVLSPDRPTPGLRGVDVGPWEPILARAMALSPRERHADAGALLEALVAALPDPSSEDRTAVPAILDQLDERTVVDTRVRYFPESETRSASSEPIILESSPLTTTAQAPGAPPPADAGLSPASGAAPPALLLTPATEVVFAAPPPSLSPLLLQTPGGLGRSRLALQRLQARTLPTLRRQRGLSLGVAIAITAVVLVVALRSSSDRKPEGQPTSSPEARAQVPARATSAPVAVDRAAQAGGPAAARSPERRVRPDWQPLPARAAQATGDQAATPSPEAAESSAGARSPRRRYVLMIDSDPRGATVVIDGQEQGVTPTSVPTRRRRHEVVLRLPGRADYRLTTDASGWRRDDSGDAILEIDAKLQPVP